MGLFSRKSATVEVDAVEAAVSSLAGTPYSGGKVPIFREGFYYLCDIDADGNEGDPDVSVPLVWRDGGFHYALPEDPNHFHSYGLNALELDPGAE